MLNFDRYLPKPLQRLIPERLRKKEKPFIHEHPPYHPVKEGALELINSNRDILNQIEPLQADGFLQTFSIFFAEADTDKNKVGQTMYEPEHGYLVFKNIWDHFLTMAQEKSGIATIALQKLLEFMSDLYHKPGLKFSDAWTILLSMESRLPVKGVVGLGNITKLGGVHRYPMSVKGFMPEGAESLEPGHETLEEHHAILLQRTLATSVITYLQNQAAWAGYIPHEGEINIHNSKRKFDPQRQRDKAKEILTEIEDNGWSKFLFQPNYDLDAHVRKPTGSPYDNQANDQSNLLNNGVFELKDIDLEIKSLDAITVRLFATTEENQEIPGTHYFTDVPVARILSLRPLELVHHIKFPVTRYPELGWQTVGKATTAGSKKESSPLFSLAVTNDHAGKNTFLDYTAADQGNMLADWVLNIKTSTLTLRSGHVPQDGASAAHDYLRRVKEVLASDMHQSKERDTPYKPNVMLRPHLPTVPSKPLEQLGNTLLGALNAVEYIKKRTTSPYISALKGKDTTARLELLRLTDFDIHLKIDAKQLSTHLKEINAAWHDPIDFSIGVALSIPEVDSGIVSRANSIYQIMNGEIENVDQQTLETLREIYPIDLNREKKVVIEEIKLNLVEEIKLTINPRYNRSQLYNQMVSAIVGPSVYCVQPIVAKHKRLNTADTPDLPVEDMNDSKSRTARRYRTAIATSMRELALARMGINPNAAITVITHQNVQLAELISGVLADRIENDSHKFAQVSDIGRSDAEYFPTAQSDFRDTLGYFIGITNDTIDWRVELKKEILDTLYVDSEFTTAADLEIPYRVAKDFHFAETGNTNGFQEKMNQMRLAMKLWHHPSLPDSGMTNSQRLEYFFDICTQDTRTIEMFLLRPETKDSTIKKDLIEGLRMLMVTAVYRQMYLVTSSTLARAEHIAKLAKNNAGWENLPMTQAGFKVPDIHIDR